MFSPSGEEKEGEKTGGKRRTYIQSIRMGAAVTEKASFNKNGLETKGKWREQQTMKAEWKTTNHIKTFCPVCSKEATATIGKRPRKYSCLTLGSTGTKHNSHWLSLCRHVLCAGPAKLTWVCDHIVVFVVVHVWPCLSALFPVVYVYMYVYNIARLS